MNTKQKKRFSFTTFIEVILILAIMFVAIFTSLAYFLFNDGNASPNFFGYNVFVMQGNGMSPTIKNNDAVIVKNGVIPDEPIGKIVLVNLSNSDVKSALRVISTDDFDGQQSYYVKSDASDSAEAIRIEQEDIIGHAIYTHTVLGSAITYACSSGGMLFFVIIPCSALLVYQVIRMFFGSSKRKNSQIDNENSEPILEIGTEMVIDDEPIHEMKQAVLVGASTVHDDTAVKAPIDKTFEKPEQAPKAEEKVDEPIEEKLEAADEIQKENDKPSVDTLVNPFVEPASVNQIPDEKIAEKPHSKIKIDSEGKAEFISSKPTADKEDLEKVLHSQQPHRHDVEEKNAMQSPIFTAPLSKSEQIASDIQQTDMLIGKILNKPKGDLTNTHEKSNFIAPNIVKSVPESKEQSAVPKSSKTQSNKTLENLMKMLDQEEAKLREMKEKKK